LRSAGGSQELGYDWYPLHNAAALNQVQRAKILLESLDMATRKKALAESDTSDSSTYTALTLAAFHGHKEMINFLIAQYDELGISINSCDADGKTALMVAAAKGHIDIFQLFAEKYLERSLSINEKDHYDNTAIHYITATSLYSSPSSEQMISYQEIISVLTNNGVNINSLNYYGKTALGMVARRNADSVTAHKIAENLDLAHLVVKLLDEDPDISTLMKRMENSNVKSTMGNEKVTAMLLLKNNANPLETEYLWWEKSQVMHHVKQDEVFIPMLKKALYLTEETAIEFDLTKNNDKLYIGLVTFNNVKLLDSDGHSKDELSTLNEIELSDFLSDLQYRYMICLWDDSIDCILS
jgi:ankyrin repeat protein